MQAVAVDRLPPLLSSPMEHLGDLIEAIYESPLSPDGWRAAMKSLHRHFGSNMEAFYFLDFGPRRFRVVHVDGVSPRWLNEFGTLYFQPDNPWARLTGRLHRPGVVRTAERLIEFTGDPGVLRRSAYFNEWMRPQYFLHTIGVTPYSENGVVANISLFRPADMPIFGAREIADLERLAPHFQRALQFGIRLDQATQAEHLSLRTLDASPDGFALVDERACLRHANARLEHWLRAGTHLVLRNGQLQARTTEASQKLATLIADAARGSAPRPLELAHANGQTLNIKAMPVPGTVARYLPARTAVLLMIGDTRAGRGTALQQARQRYGLTPAESRLAAQLTAGAGLREAAERCGVRYGTARGYLKLLFHKTGTHRQSELVARLLAEPAASPSHDAAESAA